MTTIVSITEVRHDQRVSSGVCGTGFQGVDVLQLRSDRRFAIPIQRYGDASVQIRCQIEAIPFDFHFSWVLIKNILATEEDPFGCRCRCFCVVN